MDYHQEKAIVLKLCTGTETGIAAQFSKKEEEMVLHLIANDMIKASAFLPSGKARYGVQNLAEARPVTARGRQLFGIPEPVLG